MALAQKANQMATRRKMLTHALRSRRILSALGKTNASHQIHEQFTDLRSSLLEPLSEFEKVNAMHFYGAGFHFEREHQPSDDTHTLFMVTMMCIPSSVSSEEVPWPPYFYVKTRKKVRIKVAHTNPCPCTGSL